METSIGLTFKTTHRLECPMVKSTKYHEGEIGIGDTVVALNGISIDTHEDPFQAFQDIYGRSPNRPLVLTFRRKEAAKSDSDPAAIEKPPAVEAEKKTEVQAENESEVQVPSQVEQKNVPPPDSDTATSTSDGGSSRKKSNFRSMLAAKIAKDRAKAREQAVKEEAKVESSAVGSPPSGRADEDNGAYPDSDISSITSGSQAAAQPLPAKERLSSDDDEVKMPESPPVPTPGSAPVDRTHGSSPEDDQPGYYEVTFTGSRLGFNLYDSHHGYVVVEDPAEHLERPAHGDVVISVGGRYVEGHEHPFDFAAKLLKELPRPLKVGFVKEGFIDTGHGIEYHEGEEGDFYDDSMSQEDQPQDVLSTVHENENENTTQEVEPPSPSEKIDWALAKEEYKKHAVDSPTRDFPSPSSDAPLSSEGAESVSGLSGGSQKSGIVRNSSSWDYLERNGLHDDLDYEELGKIPVGRTVWVLDPSYKHLFRPGRKVGDLQTTNSRGGATNHVTVTIGDGEGGKDYNFAANEYAVVRMQNELDDVETVDDLRELDGSTSPLILYALRLRFKNQAFYTTIGHDVLIAMKPTKYVESQYEYSKIIQALARAEMNAAEFSPDNEAPAPLMSEDGSGSTLYQLAADAFFGCRRDGHLHAMIVAGDGGAGKTEACKEILRVLSTASSVLSGAAKKESDRVYSSLVESSFLLEAFGNAEMPHNTNSSRFVNWTQLVFDWQGRIRSGKITPHIFESSRVVLQESTYERNYHAFYYLLASAPKEELKRLWLESDPQQYNILQPIKSPERDDYGYHETTEILLNLSFDKASIKSIWQILAAILHLNQVVFRRSKKGVVSIDAADDEAAITELRRAAVLLLQCRRTGGCFVEGPGWFECRRSEWSGAQPPHHHECSMEPLLMARILNESADGCKRGTG